MINVGQLHDELLAAGLPVVSVRSNGHVSYMRNLDKKEEARAAEIIAAHVPAPPPLDSAMAALAALNMKALRTSAESATSVAALRGVVLELVQIVDALTTLRKTGL